MADMNTPTNGRPKLVLLIDTDPATRQCVGAAARAEPDWSWFRLGTAWPGSKFSSVCPSAFVS